MKQYESIFFRHREMNSAEYLEVDGCGLTESCGPVIVLTIEELEQFFEAGQSCKDYSPHSFNEMFYEYLKSKGISI